MRRQLAILCLGLMLVVTASTAIFGISKDSRNYCRVKFGTEAEVVFARTSDSLLLFRSGKLDSVPETYPFEGSSLAGDKVIPPIKTGDGTIYQITSVSEFADEAPPPRRSLMLNVIIRDGDTSFRQYCDVELTGSVDQMKHAHFDGPLSAGPVTISWEVPAGLQLVIGAKPTDIRASIATLNKQAGCWTVVQSGDDEFALGVHPTVTLEFPTPDSNKPIVKKYPLDQFC